MAEPLTRATVPDLDDDHDREWLACATCNDKVMANQLPGWEPGWDSEPGLLRCPGDSPCAICGTKPANRVNYPVTETYTA
ncbi:hypothetical protein [Luteococcus sp.]|uniref:hypothetical protein n=1 Tax=Luteococcus sp. TaxID=1969402 RepID=UPI00373679E8